VVTPAARRVAVSLAREAHDVSERRACSIIGVDRSAMRYRHRRVDDAEVRTRLKELAAERRRFGWRRLKVLLAREGIRMNHKKLRRRMPRNGCRCAVVGVANEPLARERQ
jgi:putative transposase